ncbi:MAG: OmpH family outer membrane protein [Flavobacteriales bacterium]|mgnify:FL=1|jgi:outer membrane protein|nr:OmpH family outer membrane protein [Flavobacteriales bacterium]MBT6013871.1 OmpH family outer membrane protein [Flavobacteriales bacterium]MBT7481220.1 OmpH family outer membrane protein [Flavobacteriales bacterium]|tara:strand:- start:23 stop:532 length:510 start_codon:yes stop_codon:yes gene_type:complete
MKKKILVLTVIIITAFSGSAQKFAYVDTDYILTKVPEFVQAEEKINDFSTQWQQEIETVYAEVEQMYRDYQSEQILLTAEMKTKREEAIINKEKSVKSLQQKYFGPEGELYKKRQELIQPIQDRIFDAVQQLAANNKYSVIFDSSSELIMLYSNPNLDKSDKVLELMGY